MSGDLVLFFLVATIAVGSSLMVVLHPNPIYCALALVVALFQVAALFLLLGAETIAFFQLLVYAGAIMVLFLFVIMLLNVREEPAGVSFGVKAAAFGTSAVIAIELAFFFLTRPLPPAPSKIDESFGTIEVLGRSLFTDHVLSFELTSILLLVAVIGAVVMARRS